jgi:hypothetical protein
MSQMICFLGDDGMGFGMKVQKNKDLNFMQKTMY